MVSGFATLGATTTDSDELGFRPTLYPSKEVYAGEILITVTSALLIHGPDPLLNFTAQFPFSTMMVLTYATPQILQEVICRYLLLSG